MERNKPQKIVFKFFLAKYRTRVFNHFAI